MSFARVNKLPVPHISLLERTNKELICLNYVNVLFNMLVHGVATENCLQSLIDWRPESRYFSYIQDDCRECVIIVQLTIISLRSSLSQLERSLINKYKYL
jgi:hypothetical protein